MDGPGLIQVYTGNGKGKTTAALGLALRAAGRGMRTFLAQFLKQGEYGERLAIRRHLADMIVVEQYGTGEFHQPQQGVSDAERRAAVAGVAAVERAMASGRFQLVILDEVNTLLYFKILKPANILALIDGKPAEVEMVLTGRRAPPSIRRRADLITDMREIRHYFTRGVPARPGIEY